jgi:hypothetical protein
MADSLEESIKELAKKGMRPRQIATELNKPRKKVGEIYKRLKQEKQGRHRNLAATGLGALVLVVAGAIGLNSFTSDSRTQPAPESYNIDEGIKSRLDAAIRDYSSYLSKWLGKEVYPVDFNPEPQRNQLRRQELFPNEFRSIEDLQRQIDQLVRNGEQKKADVATYLKDAITKFDNNIDEVLTYFDENWKTLHSLLINEVSEKGGLVMLDNGVNIVDKPSYLVEPLIEIPKELQMGDFTREQELIDALGSVIFARLTNPNSSDIQYRKNYREASELISRVSAELQVFKTGLIIRELGYEDNPEIREYVHARLKQLGITLPEGKLPDHNISDVGSDMRNTELIGGVYMTTLQELDEKPMGLMAYWHHHPHKEGNPSHPSKGDYRGSRMLGVSLVLAPTTNGMDLYIAKFGRCIKNDSGEVGNPQEDIPIRQYRFD